MARLMSEAEQRRRQKLQSKIGRTTSTMGLTALGVTGAAALGAKKPGALKAIQKIPGLAKTTPEKMERAAIKSGIISGGIGGVGGFNQASIYSAESRRRNQTTPVKKDYGMDMGYFGEEGTPLLPTEIEAEIAKAWSPSASNFDSERNRQKRNKGYQSATIAAGGAGGALAGIEGVKAIGHARKIKTEEMAPVTHRPAVAHVDEVKGDPGHPGQPEIKAVRANAGKGVTGVKGQKEIKPRPAVEAVKGVKGRGASKVADLKGSTRAIRTGEHLGPALKHGGRAAIGLGAVGAAVGAHHALKQKRASRSWQPYAKRDAVSAFGVDHV